MCGVSSYVVQSVSSYAVAVSTSGSSAYDAISRSCRVVGAVGQYVGCSMSLDMISMFSVVSVTSHSTGVSVGSVGSVKALCNTQSVGYLVVICALKSISRSFGFLAVYPAAGVVFFMAWLYGFRSRLRTCWQLLPDLRFGCDRVGAVDPVWLRRFRFY